MKCKKSNSATWKSTCSIVFGVLFFALLIVGCSKEAEIMEEENMEEEIIHPFAGGWSGTVSGDLTGMMTFSVKNSGIVLIDVTIPDRGGLIFFGDVEESGTLGARTEESNVEDIRMNGTLEATTGTGVWTLENAVTGEDLSGTWTVGKN